MFSVSGKQLEAMFERGGGNQRIAQLQAVRKRITVDQLHGLAGNCFADGQNFCLAQSQPFFGLLQFRLVATALR